MRQAELCDVTTGTTVNPASKDQMSKTKIAIVCSGRFFRIVNFKFVMSKLRST